MVLMERILEMLKSIQGEQREFQNEMYEFRNEMHERFEIIEKYTIHNGEKLDNNRDHINKKTNFIEHKNLELEQRIYEL